MFQLWVRGGAHLCRVAHDKLSDQHRLVRWAAAWHVPSRTGVGVPRESIHVGHRLYWDALAVVSLAHNDAVLDPPEMLPVS